MVVLVLVSSVLVFVSVFVIVIVPLLVWLVGWLIVDVLFIHLHPSVYGKQEDRDGARVSLRAVAQAHNATGSRGHPVP